MPQVWEFVFLMLILKLPIGYLCWVVYWAIKSPPAPPERVRLGVPATLEPRPPWSPGRRPGRRGPHGSPARGYVRTGRARAAAE